MKSNWLDYYKKVAGRKPDPVLKLALKKLKTKGVAYDLGCGAGDDTKLLLSEGVKVFSVDKDEAAIEFVKSIVGNNKNSSFEQGAFEEMKLEPCDLIWGRVSFPFCNPEFFSQFWAEMRKSLRPNGLLCGNLFGTNDSWAVNKHMTFISHGDWEKLLEGFEILYFDEREYDGPTAAGHEKRWHIYYFILKRI